MTFSTKSTKGDSGRTTLGYRGSSSAVKSILCRRADHAVFIEGCAWCVEDTKYLLDLQFVAFDLFLVIPGVWRAHPPLKSPLDFACEPDAARYSQEVGLGLIDIPS